MNACCRIPIKLVGWEFPCPWPDKVMSPFYSLTVTGIAGRRAPCERIDPIGRRPRIVYFVGDGMRVAVGRRGETADSLWSEIRRIYPGCDACDMSDDFPALDRLADYASGTIKSAREAAAAAKMRKAALLDIASDAETMKLAVLLNDEAQSSMWREQHAAVPRQEKKQQGVGKTERTGRMTTRGRPILRKIGAECWYGGENLHRSPPTRDHDGAVRIQRWTDDELLCRPIPGNWGTRPYRHRDTGDDYERLPTPPEEREPLAPHAGA
ncbi:hypothetical protein [Thermomonas carbonis]|uniref:Uncharacterized protein n=1 Tax=Thermomonas carbonis TaxID=1463158 RepID=A0A7G9SR87_9GAMM|nr:hypothetical protein [Thermomonas carbonis]QNN70362.1 hypothetical protein H9L16_01610 [Thermomonas carbonis]GHB99516.1 hypothetical protein GCM10010080_10450 [Thermomonas carbonis]